MERTFLLSIIAKELRVKNSDIIDYLYSQTGVIYKEYSLVPSDLVDLLFSKFSFAGGKNILKVHSSWDKLYKVFDSGGKLGVYSLFNEKEIILPPEYDYVSIIANEYMLTSCTSGKGNLDNLGDIRSLDGKILNQDSLHELFSNESIFQVEELGSGLTFMRTVNTHDYFSLEYKTKYKNKHYPYLIYGDDRILYSSINSETGVFSKYNYKGHSVAGLTNTLFHDRSGDVPCSFSHNRILENQDSTYCLDIDHAIPASVESPVYRYIIVTSDGDIIVKRNNEIGNLGTFGNLYTTEKAKCSGLFDFDIYSLLKEKKFFLADHSYIQSIFQNNIKYTGKSYHEDLRAKKVNENCYITKIHNCRRYYGNFSKSRIPLHLINANGDILFTSNPLFCYDMFPIAGKYVYSINRGSNFPSIIDQFGKTIIPIESCFEYIHYEHELFIVSKRAEESYFCQTYKKGVIDTEGNVIIPLDVQKIEAYKDAIVCYSDKSVLLYDRKGHLVQTFAKEYIIEPFNEKSECLFKNGYAYITLNTYNHFHQITNTVRGIVSSSGETLYDVKYKTIRQTFKDNTVYWILSDGNLWTIENKDRVILTGNFSSIGKVQSGYTISIAVRLNNSMKYGLFDIDGNTILPIEFEHIGVRRENLCGVEKEGKWYLFNYVTKDVIRYDYINYIGTCSNGMIPYHYGGDVPTFNTLKDPEDINGVWGYLNQHGQKAIKCQYHGISSFRSNGTAFVRIYDRFMQIDKQGNVLFEEYIPKKKKHCLNNDWNDEDNDGYFEAYSDIMSDEEFERYHNRHTNDYNEEQ